MRRKASLYQRMDSQYQVLQDAIARAESNDPELDVIDLMPTFAGPGTIDIRLTDMYWMMRYSIIFNHKFAAALWGQPRKVAPGEIPANVNVATGDSAVDTASGWRYHLSMMVLADDPIEYLKNNINA